MSKSNREIFTKANSYMGYEWTEEEEEAFEMEADASARLWLTGRRPMPTRGASLQASSFTASCGRATHQT
eukprot:2952997-Pleurochrysis_carterae.AAC.1